MKKILENSWKLLSRSRTSHHCCFNLRVCLKKEEIAQIEKKRLKEEQDFMKGLLKTSAGSPKSTKLGGTQEKKNKKKKKN